MEVDRMTSGSYNRTKEHNEAIGRALRGKPKSEKHRKALCKPKTDEHKKALSVAMSRPEANERKVVTTRERYGVDHIKKIPEKNNLRVEYWVNKGHTLDEAKKIVSENSKKACALRENVISHWNTEYWIKKGYSLAEAKTTISKIQTANSLSSRRSVSQVGTRFLDKLSNELDVVIDREIFLLGKYRVDGYIPENKIVIEYFGSYWHCHPLLFEDPTHYHKSLEMTVEEKRKEDADRVKTLQENGYHVFVVWDFDEDEKLPKLVSEITHIMGEEH